MKFDLADFYEICLDISVLVKTVLEQLLLYMNTYLLLRVRK
jgi:hypothetical protein